MLYGSYSHNIDDKNRLRIPAKLKGELGSCIFTKGTDGCIFVFPKEEFIKYFQEKQQAVSLGDRDAQRPLRMLLSSAYEAEEDGQGRIALPAGLKKHAGITKNLVTIGMGARAEIWSEERWNEYNSDETDFDAVMEELKELKI